MKECPYLQLAKILRAAEGGDSVGDQEGAREVRKRLLSIYDLETVKSVLKGVRKLCVDIQVRR